ncbi:AMP-binding protein [Shewanella waksmanii]|uniref:AMP-binding protein n=1 Tax=Shewanella waksmanii TaxID=213783 RepID=UPI003735D2B6
MMLKPSQRIALYGLHRQLSYADLLDEARRLYTEIKTRSPIKRPLILLQLDTSVNAVVAYVTCRIYQLPVILLSPKQNPSLIIEKFGVNLQIYATERELIVSSLSFVEYSISSEVSVLLATSGSTGMPKLVMLSEHNLDSNAKSICEYLSINKDERALSSLPFYYSYGLSVLNSHLSMNASIVLAPADVLSKQMWNQADKYSATSFAGVPFSYEILLKLRLERVIPHSIHTLTQAGGRLAKEMILIIGNYALQNNKKFYVMYGQTEASARMAYLPADEVMDNPSSIGMPIPEGQFCIKDDCGHEVYDDGIEGELCYQGPNIMIGYASKIEDLCLISSEGIEILHTGDLAYRVNDRYYITGRLKRIIKLRGTRYNLDELQELTQQHLSTQWLFCSGEDDELYIIAPKGVLECEVKEFILSQGIPPQLTKLIFLDEPLYNQNGKPDILRMMEQASG